MNISQTARETGLKSKTIRYYESVGLIPAAHRTANGYRDYDTSDLKQLKFLRQARDFGFSIDECRGLLGLYQNPERKSAEVHQLVETKLKDVERRILELQTMQGLLAELIASCSNDVQPACAIIDSMTGQKDSVNTDAANSLAKSEQV